MAERPVNYDSEVRDRSIFDNILNSPYPVIDIEALKNANTPSIRAAKNPAIKPASIRAAYPFEIIEKRKSVDRSSYSFKQFLDEKSDVLLNGFAEIGRLADKYLPDNSAKNAIDLAGRTAGDINEANLIYDNVNGYASSASKWISRAAYAGKVVDSVTNTVNVARVFSREYDTQGGPGAGTVTEVAKSVGQNSFGFAVGASAATLTAAAAGVAATAALPLTIGIGVGFAASWAWGKVFN